MRVSTGLDENQLANIAALCQLEIDHMRPISKNVIEFVLRPYKGKSEPWYRKSRFNRGEHGRQRVWNVCHHGHTVFLGALYMLDPTAHVRCSVGNWYSAESYFADVERIGMMEVDAEDGKEPFCSLCWCDKGPGIDAEMTTIIVNAATRVMDFALA